MLDTDLLRGAPCSLQFVLVEAFAIPREPVHPGAQGSAKMSWMCSELVAALRALMEGFEPSSCVTKLVLLTDYCLGILS